MKNILDEVNESVIVLGPKKDLLYSFDKSINLGLK